MSPKEIVLKITEYITADDSCPEAYVFTHLFDLYNQGYTSFNLEEGGVLFLSYEEGNAPLIRLSDHAELDFRLVNYIAMWLDYQWKQTDVIQFRPYRTGSIVTLRKKRLPSTQPHILKIISEI